MLKLRISRTDPKHGAAAWLAWLLRIAEPFRWRRPPAVRFDLVRVGGYRGGRGPRIDLSTVRLPGPTGATRPTITVRRRR